MCLFSNEYDYEINNNNLFLLLAIHVTPATKKGYGALKLFGAERRNLRPCVICNICNVLVTLTHNSANGSGDKAVGSYSQGRWFESAGRYFLRDFFLFFFNFFFITFL